MKSALVRTTLLLLATFLTFSLASCGVMYNSRRAELLKSASPADYGPPPPGNHQEIEERMIRSRLKDPDSAQFRWGESRRDIIQQGFASPTPALVWVTSVAVNAKNSFGGYTGFEAYQFSWKEGRLFAYYFPPGYWQYVE